jgi:tRNA 2-thiouridine synthesizing protein A
VSAGDPDPRPDVVIDARGQLCPLPIIELGRAAKALVSGLIELIADDPAALADVPAWCSLRGADLVGTTTQGAETRFLVRLSAPGRPDQGNAGGSGSASARRRR